MTRSSRTAFASIRAAALLSTALLLGCEGVGMRTVADPGRSQVMRVVSGDRIYFDLEEDAASGCVWDAVCADPDVEVTVDHVADAGRAEVRILIHRGYDGPSSVRFVCRRPRGGGPPAREFTIGLYRRTGDVAFWE